jgi:hypothetical protein
MEHWIYVIAERKVLMMISSNILETKLDDKTLHFLPFVPSRARKEMEITRKWGDVICNISGNESTNAYDLITLMLVIKEYLKHTYYIENFQEQELAILEIDLVKLIKERNLINKKINRKTITESIIRLTNLNLIFIKNNKIHSTNYFYDIKYDKNYKEITLYANLKFIEKIKNNGILINLSEFIKLENIKENGSNYAILLYTFLIGTKTKFKLNNKIQLQWREKYREDILFNVLNLNNTNLNKAKRREKLQKAFNILHKYLNLPQYKFNNINEIWMRTDLAKKRLKSVV